MHKLRLDALANGFIDQYEINYIVKTTFENQIFDVAIKIQNVPPLGFYELFDYFENDLHGKIPETKEKDKLKEALKGVNDDYKKQNPLVLITYEGLPTKDGIEEILKNENSMFFFRERVDDIPLDFYTSGRAP